MLLRCFRAVAVFPFVACTLIGCGASPTAGPRIEEGLDRSERSVDVRPPQTSSADAAIINGTMVTRAELWEELAEYGAGLILEERVLDLRLERELERRGVRLTDADIEAEEQALLFLVLGRAAATDEEAGRIIIATRDARGLGPKRYESLLRRNAMLRRVIREDVDIQDEDVERLHLVRHGPKVRARIIVLPSEREASQLRGRLLQESAGSVEFAIAAMEHSIDATSARGGLIEVFSTSDPAYPASARLALQRVQPGELTTVIALEGGFAFLLLEETVKADGVAYEDVEVSLRRELRLRQERVLMQQRALELIDSTRVTPVDQGVGWSWKQRIESRQP